MKKVLVKNLGPIKNAKLELEDLTIFSGPNASGKGILLQLIKLIIDKENIPAQLHLKTMNGVKAGTNFLNFISVKVWRPFGTKIPISGLTMKHLN